MARKALFATDDQPAKKTEEEDIDKVAGGGDDAASELEQVEAKEKEASPSPKKRPQVAAQTPEQRKASLGIEDGLLDALKNKADDETLVSELKEQAICCGELALQRLTQAGHISGGDAQAILESYGYYVEDVKEGKNILDILPFHVWVKLDTKDERADKEIRQMTSQLSSALPMGITHCDFDRLADTSLELFEKFPLAEKVCSTLMCPIVQAHERDYVSIASINPLTAATVGFLLENIMEREGIKPFTFVFTMDSSAWADLCQKQFGSEV